MAWYVTAGLYLWHLFVFWLKVIFIIPFKTLDMLWLLVPIWLVWFFAEFFQEKLGTSMGNAITNAVVVLWASVDSTRKTIAFISEKVITGILNISLRFALLAGILTYAITIIALGLKGNELIKKIGRVREVTYVFAMYVPVFYNAIPLNWDIIVASIVFFPIFYYAIEFLDRFTPNPKLVKEDIEDKK